MDNNGDPPQDPQPTYTTTPYQVVNVSTQEAISSADQPSPEAGRPSKFKPEYCQMLVDHMEKGYSLDSFGSVVSVARNTLYEWQKKYPEFKEAVEIGQAKSLLWWEKAGMQGMLGLPISYKDSVTGETRHTNGAINASIYALQMANKHKWRTGREDITSDDKKIDPVVLYVPQKVPEGSE